jgi:GNAT superfamily N-acetyltransferase
LSDVFADRPVPEVEVREPSTAAELERYYDLRWRILREPWTDQKESGLDELEDSAIHLMAWCGQRLIGVGRLHFNSADEAQVRFMAVEPDWRRKGAGSAILHKLERQAAKRGANRVVLNARQDAIEFYRSHGYAITRYAGALFGIDHWEMRKTVAE